jgi:cellulose biosynthesis protein BcsQ
VCTSLELLGALLINKQFDSALIGTEFLKNVNLEKIRLPLILWDGIASLENHQAHLIKKYQRISSIVSDILELYSQITPGASPVVAGRGRITVVFSPVGGSGKTTVSLAYAARMSLSGKTALYLNLEPFCSTPAFFGNEGKSISKVFESLYSGNLEMLVQSFMQKNNETGIFYFRAPENYDDINELTEENITKLVLALTAKVDEVVIDIGSICNQQSKTLFDMADRVLLVADNSWSSQAKLQQFTEQYNIFEKVKDKTTVIANKSAKVGSQRAAAVIELPAVQSNDGKIIFETLSAREF